ncbi:hypothetical protein BOTNAR_0335g00020 [Botryotinia narcissicola]|uniref:Uncharacterized protein n=1 Tax=Botryotinia narcissicola TaxID=278944 RepID=A0A4Z1HT62_9HELO|nr:hypothetical protein BOTNAR_0335g00020 [Botryotinia narcissicola]
MCNVRIVFGGIGRDVVDIVIALPPADGEPAEEIRKQDPDAAVDVEGVRYPHVSGVVRGKDELVPEESEGEGGGNKEFPEECEEQDVPQYVDAVGSVWTVV